MDLVAFYRGEEPDYQGRRLEDMLAWNDVRLEMFHDYIQVLFPLRDPSFFSSRAPLLDDATIASFRADEKIRANLTRAFERMLLFYGLRHDGASGTVVRTDEFALKARHWLFPGDHNYRRITRILHSLTLLGLEDRARAFFEALTDIYREFPADVGEETFRYWEHAGEAGR
jgi:hypothetical protein